MNEVFLEAARLDLARLEQAFVAGDRSALLAAIRVCAACDLPLPAWASRAYIAAYDQVLNCRAKTWDEAFGPAFPKGANLNAQRKRRNLRFEIHNAVLGTIQREPETPIDAGLFETIGERFGIGKTEAENLYRSAIRLGAVDAAEWKKKAGW